MNISVRHIIAVILILASALVFNYYTKGFKYEKAVTYPDTSAIKSAFEHKHEMMLAKLEYVESIVSDRDSLLDFFYVQQKELFARGKIGIFFYENNKLKYWTTNDIPLPLSTTPLFFYDKVLNLNNGWYSTETIIRDDYHIVALLQIKQEYAYENDLLITKFNPELNIKYGFDIISDSVENAISIELSKNNTEKIYLIADERDIQIKPNIFRLLSLIFTLSALLLLLFVFYKYAIQIFPNKVFLFSLLFFALIVYGRYLMLDFKRPECFYMLKLFSPELFAQSFWLPSLGDFILNTVLFLFIAIIFNRFIRFNIKAKTNSFLNILYSVSLSILISICSWFICRLFYGLVWNSSILFSFENVINLDYNSFLGLAIIFGLITGFILVFDRLLSELKNIIGLKTFLIILFPVIIISSFILKYPETGIVSKFIFLIALYLLWTIIAYIRLSGKSYSYYKIIIIIILISALTAERFSVFTAQKEIDTGRVLAYNLATERDIRAEYFLNKINSYVNSNFTKNNTRSDYEKNITRINNIFLTERYFNKYDIQITICFENDSLLIEPDDMSVNCFDFFDEIVNKYGIILPETNFYFLDNHNGRISYFGEFAYGNEDLSETKLFIELNSKIFSEGLGYPELLLEKRLAVKRAIKDYNYAKYHKGKLITSKGDFKYPILMDERIPEREDVSYFSYEGFIHFVYHPDEHNTIILSKEELRYSKELVSFSYIFSILFLFSSLILFFVKFRFILRKAFYTLKSKIQVSFIGILMLALIVTGSIAIYFIIKGYKDKQYEFLEDKVQSILIELEHEFGNQTGFNVEDIRYLDYLLVRLSNVFYTDINLYTPEGILFTTSRKEIYDQGLKGRYLDPDAYERLIMQSSGSVIINEKIDKVNYLSAYIPFRNNDNELIAYLNLPYFARQNEFREEISNFIVAFSNVFLVLILISVIIGVIISKQVTRPLSIIQEKIRQMDIKKKTEKIKYDKDDELGGLIREYNKKVDELTESVNKLAQSERETAWREMAKQIAHEIKNPLTPMKLSVQYLEHTYDKKDEKWEKTFRKVCTTLIEQIDILAEIATEFSNFAKMPVSKTETNNIIDIINNTVQLFKSSENIKFTTSVNINSDGLISADKEQMTRAFNNLITNSIQAVPKEKPGEINIIVDETHFSYIIRIIDNGKGIDEKMLPKIFQPNFTTKSGGMGLGLSMVKNIIDSNNGKISFKTEKDKGTEFIIELRKIGGKL